MRVNLKKQPTDGNRQAMDLKGPKRHALKAQRKPDRGRNSAHPGRSIKVGPSPPFPSTIDPTPPCGIQAPSRQAQGPQPAERAIP